MSCDEVMRHPFEARSAVIYAKVKIDRIRFQTMYDAGFEYCIELLSLNAVPPLPCQDSE